jgi:hypothetical protein
MLKISKNELTSFFSFLKSFTQKNKHKWCSLDFVCTHVIMSDSLPRDLASDVAGCHSNQTWWTLPFAYASGRVASSSVVWIPVSLYFPPLSPSLVVTTYSRGQQGTSAEYYGEKTGTDLAGLERLLAHWFKILKSEKSFRSFFLTQRNWKSCYRFSFYFE